MRRRMTVFAHSFARSHSREAPLCKPRTTSTRSRTRDRGRPSTSKGDEITINDANLIASVRASNGIVHVIDTVLIPPK